MIKGSTTARSSLFRRPEPLPDLGSQALQPPAVSPNTVNFVNTPANMTVPELELLLHQETLRGLRDLSREATGRRRRRLEGELRRQGDWVRHWPVRGDLNQQSAEVEASVTGASSKPIRNELLRAIEARYLE
jgi:hypothetical protein